MPGESARISTASANTNAFLTWHASLNAADKANFATYVRMSTNPKRSGR